MKISKTDFLYRYASFTRPGMPPIADGRELASGLMSTSLLPFVVVFLVVGLSSLGSIFLDMLSGKNTDASLFSPLGILLGVGLIIVMMMFVMAPTILLEKLLQRAEDEVEITE